MILVIFFFFLAYWHDPFSELAHVGKYVLSGECMMNLLQHSLISYLYSSTTPKTVSLAHYPNYNPILANALRIIKGKYVKRGCVLSCQGKAFVSCCHVVLWAAPCLGRPDAPRLSCAARRGNQEALCPGMNIQAWEL